MFKVSYEIYDDLDGVIDPIVLIDYDGERFSLYFDHVNESYGGYGWYVSRKVEAGYEFYGAYATFHAACEDIFTRVRDRRETEALREIVEMLRGLLR